MLYPLWIRKKLSKYTHIEYTLSPWLSRENVRKTYFARCMPTGYRKSHFPMIKWKIIIYKLSLGCKKHPRFLNFYLQNDRFRYRPCSRGAHKWRFVFYKKRRGHTTSSHVRAVRQNLISPRGRGYAIKLTHPFPYYIIKILKKQKKKYCF